MKYLITLLVWLIIPFMILANDLEWICWTPEEWGIFITSFIGFMCFCSLWIAMTDRTNENN